MVIHRCYPTSLSELLALAPCLWKKPLIRFCGMIFCTMCIVAGAISITRLALGNKLGLPELEFSIGTVTGKFLSMDDLAAAP